MWQGRRDTPDCGIRQTGGLPERRQSRGFSYEHPAGPACAAGAAGPHGVPAVPGAVWPPDS